VQNGEVARIYGQSQPQGDARGEVTRVHRRVSSGLPYSVTLIHETTQSDLKFVAWYIDHKSGPSRLAGKLVRRQGSPNVHRSQWGRQGWGGRGCCGSGGGSGGVRPGRNSPVRRGPGRNPVLGECCRGAATFKRASQWEEVGGRLAPATSGDLVGSASNRGPRQDTRRTSFGSKQTRFRWRQEASFARLARIDGRGVGQLRASSQSAGRIRAPFLPPRPVRAAIRALVVSSAQSDGSAARSENRLPTLTSRSMP
jgi:hypothetical protein